MTGLDTGLAHEISRIEFDRSFPDPSSTNSNSYDSPDIISQLPISEVLLNSLERGFFLRDAGTDPAHVKLLADAASSIDLPPILVQKHSSRVVDGMHRLEAAKLRGEKTIRARFIDCTDKDAFILAVKSNTLHGLPLSRNDRLFGAKRILTWHPDWSDRAVGMATGLSAKTIAGLRRRSSNGAQEFGKRLGRDGKRRPVTGSEGRKRAVEYITARPDASLREIAREADVSLGTVQDVRARMRRGVDPLTTGGSRPSLKQVATPKEPAAPANWPPHGDVISSREMRRNAQQLTWSAIADKLANDPSLKYTEGGRTFIRWMTLHVMHAGEWTEFVDAVPPHWLRDVSLIAAGVSEEWRKFAEQLRSRQSPAV
jgi:ParB-like chromosome segregation protein Spo0J